MIDLQSCRKKLLCILQQRKKQINSLSYTRRRSRKTTTDESLISAAGLFEQWGFMDYIASRTLLLSALETSRKPPLPRKFTDTSPISEQLHQFNRQYVASALSAGELIWPACSLAATSVEKYCKAIITIGKKKIPDPTHLTSSLISEAENSVPKIFCVLDQQFFEALRTLYDLRYPTNTANPCALTVSVRGILAELDFTIPQLNESVQILVNGLPQDSSYSFAKKIQNSALYKENYLLMGQKKVVFWRQHDLQGTLSSFGDANDITRIWTPRENQTTEEFFYARNIIIDPVTIEARKADHADITAVLKRTATIQAYTKKKEDHHLLDDKGMTSVSSKI